jgi:hypothetical protein
MSAAAAAAAAPVEQRHWQPQLQLLQQGGGEVLLQGLTLAVHCGSLDRQLRRQTGLSVRELLQVLKLPCDVIDESLLHRRDLFVSQLARKHPVAFFQFLDLCARASEEETGSIPHLVQLLKQGSSKVGVKGLVDLLSSPAATAALGSALCSVVKGCVPTALHETESTVGHAAAAGGQTRLQPSMEVIHTVARMSSALALALKCAMAATATASSSSIEAQQDDTTTTSSSSSRSGQARSSAVLISVLLCRALMRLHHWLAPAAATGVDRDSGLRNGSVLEQQCLVRMLLVVVHTQFALFHCLPGLREAAAARSRAEVDAAESAAAAAGASAAAAAASLCAGNT